MKKYILALSIVLFCAGLALAEESVNQSVNSTRSDAQFSLVNLIDLAGQKEADLKSDINITPVASADNASVNLVLAPPRSILKMHYHKFRDEIAYVIKGQAAFNVSGQEYAIKAGDLMYIPSGTLHGLTVTGNESMRVISTFAPAFDGKDRIYV
jgi:quercetin dioxygenase-like cupin family protein